MYFGYIDLKMCLKIATNLVLILIIYTFISLVSDRNLDRIMQNNGFYKTEINGFEYYAKEISSISNNIHTLSYTGMVPVVSLNVYTDDLPNAIDYDVGIKVKCNNTQANRDGEYYLLKSSFEDNVHCDICGRYIGEKLIYVFNEKEGIILPNINTKSSEIQIYKIILGIITATYGLLWIIVIFYSLIYFIIHKKPLKTLKAWNIGNRVITYSLILTVLVSFFQLYILNLQ